MAVATGLSGMAEAVEAAAGKVDSGTFHIQCVLSQQPGAREERATTVFSMETPPAPTMAEYDIPQSPNPPHRVPQRPKPPATEPCPACIRSSQHTILKSDAYNKYNLFARNDFLKRAAKSIPLMQKRLEVEEEAKAALELLVDLGGEKEGDPDAAKA